MFGVVSQFKYVASFRYRMAQSEVEKTQTIWLPLCFLVAFSDSLLAHFRHLSTDTCITSPPYFSVLFLFLAMSASCGKAPSVLFFLKLGKRTTLTQNQPTWYSTSSPLGLVRNRSAPTKPLPSYYKTFPVTSRTTKTAGCVGTSRIKIQPCTY